MSPSTSRKRSSTSYSASAEGDPPIHRYRLARDVPCPWARQERRQVPDVLRRLLATQRHAVLHHLQEDVARVAVRVLRNAHLHPRRQTLPGTRPEEPWA